MHLFHYFAVTSTVQTVCCCWDCFCGNCR